MSDFEILPLYLTVFVSRMKWLVIAACIKNHYLPLFTEVGFRGYTKISGYLMVIMYGLLLLSVLCLLLLLSLLHYYLLVVAVVMAGVLLSVSCINHHSVALFYD